MGNISPVQCLQTGLLVSYVIRRCLNLIVILTGTGSMISRRSLNKVGKVNKVMNDWLSLADDF